MRKLTWILVAAMLAAPGLRAAAGDKLKKPEAAKAVADAVSDQAPTVNPDGSPVVTDPDLQEAVPAMRQGTDEPVGGYKEAGLKGRGGLSLGWKDYSTLGWTYWFTDRIALRASLGGEYDALAGGPVKSELEERVGLRFVAVPLGREGHVFVQLGGGAGQKRYYYERRLPQAGFDQIDTTSGNTHEYQLGLESGVEVFWPGGRSVSLEATAGLRALWTFDQTVNQTDYQPGTAGVATRSENDSEEFNFRSGFSGIATAVNVYF